MIRVSITVLFLLVIVAIASYANLYPAVFWSKFRYKALIALQCEKVNSKYIMHSGGGIYSDWECKEK